MCIHIYIGARNRGRADQHGHGCDCHHYGLRYALCRGTLGVRNHGGILQHTRMRLRRDNGRARLGWALVHPIRDRPAERLPGNHLNHLIENAFIPALSPKWPWEIGGRTTARVPTLPAWRGLVDSALLVPFVGTFVACISRRCTINQVVMYTLPFTYAVRWFCTSVQVASA